MRYRAERWSWGVPAPTHRWRIVLVTLLGAITCFFIIPGVDVIDNTNNAPHGQFTPDQGVVNGVAVTTWFVATSLVVLAGVHWWRRKVAWGSDDMVKLPARRSIYLARRVVTDVVVAGAPSDRRASCALTLRNGAQIEVPRSRARRSRSASADASTAARTRGRPKSVDDVAEAIRAHLNATAPAVSGETSAAPVVGDGSEVTLASPSFTFGGLVPSPSPPTSVVRATTGVTTAAAPVDAVLSAGEVGVGMRRQLIRTFSVASVWIIVALVVTDHDAVTSVAAAMVLASAVLAATRRVRDLRVGTEWLSVRVGRDRWRTIDIGAVVCVKGRVVTLNRRNRSVRSLRFYDATGRTVSIGGLWLTPAIAQQLSATFAPTPAWTTSAALIAAESAETTVETAQQA